MKKKKISTALLLLLAAVLALAVVQCAMEPEPPQNSTVVSMDISTEGEAAEEELDEKVIWQGSIEEDFDGNCNM